MNEKLLMIGSGAMATAIAKVFHDANKTDVLIYGIEEAELNDLNNAKNTSYFNKNAIIPKFNVCSDLSIALKDVKYIAIAVPSKVYHLVLNDILKYLNCNVILINISKGFFPNTELSIHQGIIEKTKDNGFITDVISLIGPSHAEEIVREIPTAVAIINENEDVLKKIEHIFQTDYFRTYRQTDVIGSQVGVAYKNVIAISTGIAKGLGYGINTIAAIIARSLNEIKKFNKIMNGKDDTLMGLAGIGDLIVTATSDLSRNFSFGKEVAINKNEALKSKKTIEGLTALKIIYKIGKKHNLELPIVESLYNIIYNDLDPHQAAKDIFKRSLKSE